jgi:hypothetical protein
MHIYHTMCQFHNYCTIRFRETVDPAHLNEEKLDEELRVTSNSHRKQTDDHKVDPKVFAEVVRSVRLHNLGSEIFESLHVITEIGKIDGS